MLVGEVVSFLQGAGGARGSGARLGRVGRFNVVLRHGGREGEVEIDGVVLETIRNSAEEKQVMGSMKSGKQWSHQGRFRGE